MASSVNYIPFATIKFGKFGSQVFVEWFVTITITQQIKPRHKFTFVSIAGLSSPILKILLHLIKCVIFNHSNLKEQWKLNRGDLIPSSMIHHGRALLNYQGDDERTDLDKPLVFGPVRQTVAKAADPSMLNTSQKKSSLFKSINTERRDLMVIKNKWDFLNDPRQRRRISKNKRRNSKSRQKIESKQRNGTLDDQFYCPTSFNKTEVTRYSCCPCPKLIIFFFLSLLFPESSSHYCFSACNYRLYKLN